MKTIFSSVKAFLFPESLSPATSAPTVPMPTVYTYYPPVTTTGGDEPESESEFDCTSVFVYLPHL